MKAPNEKLAQLLYAGCITVAFIFLYGYQFNRGDLSEHLPQVYRMFNPGLYQGDFFLSHYDQTFTVRAYWVWLVYGVSRLIGVEWACFVLHFVCVWSCILLWMKITVQITGEKLTAYLSPLFIFLLFNSITIGGNRLQGTAFVSSIPAEVLASWGILLWLRERKYYAAVCFGLATLFQALVGLQWGILIVVVQFFSPPGSKSLKRSFKLFLVYLLAASPMLIPVLQRQLMTPETYDKDLYYRILFIYRNVRHYIPSLFPLRDYLAFCALLMGGVIALKYQKPNAKVMMIRAFMLCMIGGCVLYFILLQGFHINAIGKLQWFKTTVWINAFCCVLMSGGIIGYFTQLRSLPERKWVLYAMSFCIVCGVFIITNASLLPDRRLQSRYQVGNYRKTDLQRLHEWVSMNTPLDAVFLVPPDDDSFGCEAKRPTPVNYKAVIHEPFFFVDWYHQVDRYYHVDFASLGDCSAACAAKKGYETILRYPEQNPAKFRIDDLQRCKFADSLGPIVHVEGNWILTAIK